MKKTMAAAWVLGCAVFLCACVPGGPGKTEAADEEGGRAELSVNVPEEAAASTDGQPEDTQPEDTQPEDTQQSGAFDDGQEDLPSAQMRGLMQGVLGGIGSGVVAYTLPGQEGEDYRLCFFEEDRIGAEFSMWEMDGYSLETADYIFPDARENNAPVGRFTEIYFFDTIAIGEAKTPGIAVVATYSTDGGNCYDTRIYSWDGTGYRVEEGLTEELNERYSSAEDYPAQKLYHLSAAAAGQGPGGENQAADSI